MKKYQQTLAIIWLIGSAATATILFFQMQSGHFAGKEKEVWSWFLPNVMPTLLLIIGVLVASAIKPTINPANPDSFLFKVTAGVSVFYLFLVFATVAFQFTGTPALDLMRNANFLLGPMQGLTAATLGVFFAK
jgi:hypothetical protein